MKKTLIIGKNSYLGSKFNLLNNSNIISYKSINKVSFHEFDVVILLSMPNYYKKKNIRYKI